jgi:hypothetical protein
VRGDAPENSGSGRERRAQGGTCGGTGGARLTFEVLRDNVETWERAPREATAFQALLPHNLICTYTHRCQRLHKGGLSREGKLIIDTHSFTDTRSVREKAAPTRRSPTSYVDRYWGLVPPVQHAEGRGCSPRAPLPTCVREEGGFGGATAVSGGPTSCLLRSWQIVTYSCRPACWGGWDGRPEARLRGPTQYNS